MSDTRVDFEICCDTWTCVTWELGVDAGASMIIQNKDRARVLIVASINQPDDGCMDGFLLDNYRAISIDAGESLIWAKSIVGNAVINAQEA